MDFWFGTDCSRTRKRGQPAFGAASAGGLIRHAHGAIDDWIRRLGVQLSGGVEALTVNKTKKYRDDGTIISGVAMGAVELEADVGEGVGGVEM